MRVPNPRSKPATLKETVKYLRLGLGLPILRGSWGLPPLGYKIHPTDSTVLVPDTRILRALRKAYEARDKGYTADIIARWFKRNTGQELNTQTFSRLYHNRPIFAEIGLPLHERRRIYRLTLSEAEEEAKDVYQESSKPRTSRSGEGRPEIEDLEESSDD